MWLLVVNIDNPIISRSFTIQNIEILNEAYIDDVLEDAGEGVRYELCHSHHHDHDDDLHVHFFCTKCHRTFCLEDTPIPAVRAPEGYEVETRSYLLKGVCPECAG